MPILQITRLNKSFSTPGGAGIHALNNVSFSVDEGQCFGLLGPNGAGKTTTLEILEGLQRADSGQIQFRGESLDRQYKARMGILFQQTALPELLTVKECLTLFHGLYATAGKPREHASLEALIDACALTEFLHLNHRALSGGQRQRLLLALALINDPEIIFLDEPTTGLDPQARQNFWSLVETLKKRGKTLLLTTHYMDEAERLCDRIAILDNGSIIADDTPAALLRQHFRGFLFRIPVPRDNTAVDWAPALGKIALQKADLERSSFVQAALEKTVSEQTGIDGKTVLERTGIDEAEGSVEFEVDDITVAIEQLKQSQVPLDKLQIRSPDLEDLFLKLTGHALRD